MKQTLIVATLALGLQISAQAGDGPAYPEGYRLWTHVKSMTIHPGHPLEDPFLGIHHIYANPAALEGYKSGSFCRRRRDRVRPAPVLDRGSRLLGG